MPPDTLETLRHVNHYLCSALLRLSPEQNRCSAIQPQDFFNLLSQLLLAAECLPHTTAPSEATTALQAELLEYRHNLESLQRLLPDLHQRLLAEKARLERAQSHVAAATAWARASRKTL